MHRARSFPLVVSILGLASAAFLASCKSDGDSATSAAAATEPVRQLSFATPEDAATALRIASVEHDQKYLREIFGPEASQLGSGDPIVDQRDLSLFASAMTKHTEIERTTDATATILVGDGAVPFPVPLMRTQDRWMFDTLAGVDNMTTLRIGYDELRTIAFMRALPGAQAAYFATDWDGDAMNEYATRLLSTAGHHDGLYWPPTAGEPASPLGPYAAEGDAGASHSEATGYNGYFFRVLTAQGAGAPGGARDWMRNGQLVDGFAVIAWPAMHGETGVMAFLVGADGVVYQRDLGDGSTEAAQAIVAFDPTGWTQCE